LSVSFIVGANPLCPAPSIGGADGKPIDEASPHAAMRRCKACSRAHNPSIAALLTLLCALPDVMMLASSHGLARGLFEPVDRGRVSARSGRDDDAQG
jgi:hypothetical protein